MHRTAVENARLFAEVYLADAGAATIVEIGSQDVNGSIRPVFGDKVRYIGVDFANARGVDVVLEDPYRFPFGDDEIDAVVTSSCFEHSEFFWLTFLEAVRITRPGGLIYLNAPSNGPVHGYPVDCWRFYPDSGPALARWAVRNGQEVTLLESYTGEQEGGYLNDFVAVFLKGSDQLGAYPNRILDRIQAFTNGYVHGEPDRRRPQSLTEDQRNLLALQKFLEGRLKPI
ncbi:MAG: methyltransferase domain-containing protein [Phenylobacterium sp.]|nr:MAG: methyltransferase domain-containing protein [Phenylobacterium sp.]